MLNGTKMICVTMILGFWPNGEIVKLDKGDILIWRQVSVPLPLMSWQRPLQPVLMYCLDSS